MTEKSINFEMRRQKKIQDSYLVKHFGFPVRFPIGIYVLFHSLHLCTRCFINVIGFSGFFFFLRDYYSQDSVYVIFPPCFLFMVKRNVRFVRIFTLTRQMNRKTNHYAMNILHILKIRYENRFKLLDFERFCNFRFFIIS